MVDIETEAPPERAKILEKAFELTTGDRNATYGDPYTNLKMFGEMVGAFLGVPVSAVQASTIMVLAKISRVAVNDQHRDNYVDGAAYMAIAGECAVAQNQATMISIFVPDGRHLP